MGSWKKKYIYAITSKVPSKRGKKGLLTKKVYLWIETISLSLICEIKFCQSTSMMVARTNLLRFFVIQTTGLLTLGDYHSLNFHTSILAHLDFYLISHLNLYSHKRCQRWFWSKITGWIRLSWVLSEIWSCGLLLWWADRVRLLWWINLFIKSFFASGLVTDLSLDRQCHGLESTQVFNYAGQQRFDSMM